MLIKRSLPTTIGKGRHIHMCIVKLLHVHSLQLSVINNTTEQNCQLVTRLLKLATCSGVENQVQSMSKSLVVLE